MKKLWLTPLLAASAVALTSVVRADEFLLTYTSTENISLSMTFDGTLEGNIIPDMSNVLVDLGGDTFTVDYLIFGTQISLDATQNAFNLEGISGSFISSYTYTNPAYGGIYAESYSPANVTLDDDSFHYNAVNASWKITDLSQASVPEGGASLTLLGLGLLGLALMRLKGDGPQSRTTGSAWTASWRSPRFGSKAR